jgi:hypothetical protein
MNFMPLTIVLAYKTVINYWQQQSWHNAQLTIPGSRVRLPPPPLAPKNGKENGQKDLYDLPNKFQICAEVEYSIGIIESNMSSNASWEYFKTWTMRQHL